MLVEQGYSSSPIGTAFGSSSNLQVQLPTQPSASSFSFSLANNSQAPARPPTQHPFSGVQQPTAPTSSFSFRLPSSTTPAVQPAAFPNQQSQSLFGIANMPQTSFRFPSAVFPSNSTVPSPFNSQPVSQTLPSSNAIPDPKLSASDLEQYRADKFLFGKIPRTPPSRDLR